MKKDEYGNFIHDDIESVKTFNYSGTTFIIDEYLEKEDNKYIVTETNFMASARGNDIKKVIQVAKDKYDKVKYLKKRL